MRILAELILTASALASVLSHLSAGLEAYDKENYAKAQAEFNAVIKNFPVCQHTDDAYYWSGKCQIKMNKPDEARRSFNMIVEKFPQSEYLEKAREELRALQANVPGAKDDFSQPENTWKIFCGALKNAEFDKAYQCLGKELREQKFPALRDLKDSYSSETREMLAATTVVKTEYPGENLAVVEVAFGQDAERSSVKIKMILESGKWLLAPDGAVEKSGEASGQDGTTVPKFTELPTSNLQLELTKLVNKVNYTITCSATVIFDFPEKATPRTAANLMELDKASRLASDIIRASFSDKLRAILSPELSQEKLGELRPELERMIISQGEKAFQKIKYPGKISEVIFTVLTVNSEKPSEKQ